MFQTFQNKTKLGWFVPKIITTLQAHFWQLCRNIQDKVSETVAEYGWWALILKDKTRISTETNLV